jgi:hypothetical protein
MERKRQSPVAGETSGAVLDIPKVENTQCNHYWVIDSPRGPTSGGICKFCGARKEFDNWGPDSFRYGDVPDILVPSIADVVPDDKGKAIDDSLADRV